MAAVALSPSTDDARGTTPAAAHAVVAGRGGVSLGRTPVCACAGPVVPTGSATHATSLALPGPPPSRSTCWPRASQPAAAGSPTPPPGDATAAAAAATAAAGAGAQRNSSMSAGSEKCAGDEKPSMRHSCFHGTYPSCGRAKAHTAVRISTARWGGSSSTLGPRVGGRRQAHTHFIAEGALELCLGHGAVVAVWGPANHPAKRQSVSEGQPPATCRGTYPRRLRRPLGQEHGAAVASKSAWRRLGRRGSERPAPPNCRLARCGRVQRRRTHTHQWPPARRH